MSDDRKHRGTGALIIGLALLLGACEPREPRVTPFVEDRAGLLTAADESSISSWHAALLRQYDIDYRVLTVDSADDLSALAVRTFAAIEVGGRSASGRGLLLVVDAGGERVRLEVGRELEGVFVDSFAAFVEREQLAPFFAAGRVGDGIVATTELIAAQAEAAIARGELVARAADASSAGAGAESRTYTGSGYQRPEARRMLANHVVTRAQMDNLVRSYRACPPPRVRIADDAAVVDHPGESGSCAPWLLQRGADGLWRLDLLTMQRALRFDTRNRWQVAVPEALGPYAFAFGR